MILDTIAESTRRRLAQTREESPLALVREKALALPKGNLPFRAALAKPGISFICEIKRASPSRGIIVDDFPYLNIARDYERAGASAVSVLTEPEFFLGSPAYLEEIARTIRLPVLRKDFIIDEYQIYESKLLGASAILLICALLSPQELAGYIELASSLGLDALVETHDAAEVKTALAANAAIIGVNNRNLHDFSVDIQNSLRLRPLVPQNILFVAESGISKREDVELLADAGTNAVLIGESLMKTPDKSAFLAALCV